MRSKSKKWLIVVMALAVLLQPLLGVREASAFVICPSEDSNGVYQISNAEDLNCVRDDLDGKYELTNDIDLTDYIASAGGSWTPIGSSGNPFVGSFDGKGHTITGLTINQPAASELGLFGNVSLVSGSPTGVIQNLTIDGAAVSGASNVAVLAGYVNGVPMKNVKITNSTVTSTADRAGLLVGQNSGNVTSSSVEGTVTGKNSVGGLFGQNYGTISKSYADVTLIANGGQDAGGIVGNNQGILTNLYAKGTLTATQTGNVGGIAGTNLSSMQNVYSVVTIVDGGNSSALGAVVGNNSGWIASGSVFYLDTVGAAGTVGEAKTDADLKQESMFVNAGWDFTNTWFFNPDAFGGYSYPVFEKPVNYDFAGGSGTAADPFQIETVQHLINMALPKYQSTVPDTWKYFVMKNDLALEGNWAPLGTSSVPFNGILDGGNHKITGLKATYGQSSEGVGLFGYMNNATVKNLTISQATIEAGREAGIVSGHVEKSRFYDIQVSGTVTGYGYLGGLVGNGIGAYISDSSADVTVRSAPDLAGGSQYYGGVIGSIHPGTIVNSYATGEVNAPAAERVGGLIGDAVNLTVRDSFSTGKVTGKLRVGGFAGALTSIPEPGSTGVVIFTSFAMGDVVGAEDVGGFAGFAGGFDMISLKDTFAYGRLYSNNAETASNFGGYIGFAQQYVDNSINVRHAYAAGNVIIAPETAVTAESVGPFFGKLDLRDHAPGGIQHIYYDKEAFTYTGSRSVQPYDVTGKTAAEMRQQSTFGYWDFTQTWTMVDLPTNGYPYLRFGINRIPDNAPPVWANTYPKVKTATSTSANIGVQINETGTVFYVVVPDGAQAPSASQVKAGTDAQGQAVAKSGSVLVLANTENTIPLTGLAMNTNYDVYAVAQDSAAPPNLQAAAAKVDVGIMDDAPPVFAQTYPKPTLVTADTAKIAVQINEAGKVYYVLVPQGDPVPTNAQVKAGTDADGETPLFFGSKVVTADTQDEFTMSGLISETAYDVYFVAEDLIPNLQLSATKVSITTADITPPVFAPTYPKLSSVTGTSADLKVQINEAGKVYYAVVPQGAPAPTNLQVKAGTDSNGDASILHGSKTVSADTEDIFALTGLHSETEYDLYVIAEDDEASPNIQTMPVRLQLTTLDVTAPETAHTYPKMESVSYTTAEFSTMLNDAGTVYYVVLPRDAAAPTSEQVKTGTNSQDEPVTLHGSDTAEADTVKLMPLSGLTANTEYDLYVAAEDQAAPPNLQAHPAKLQFKTLAMPVDPPVTDTPTPPAAPSTPSSGSKVEEINVEVQTGEISLGTVVSLTPIKRITEPTGTIRDDVTLTAERAGITVKALAESGEKTARVVIPDTEDKVSKVDFTMPKSATKLLTDGKIDLEVYTENARIIVPQQSLISFLDEDMYFRLVPIKKAEERQVVQERARMEQSVQALSNGQEVTAVARPMTIETNMQSREVTLVLPLRDVQLPKEAAEREAYLNQLIIFIEHSDGDKEIVRSPRVVTYGANDELLGLEFDVNKFSTFTILHVDTDEHSPYINGYPDHTFRPEAYVTRAEMAAMLARNLAPEAKADGAASFPDVEKHWAFASIETVNDLNMMQGYKNGFFGPQDDITRAQMAMIVYRWLNETGALEEAGRAEYADLTSSHWAYEAIIAIWQSGIMTGYEDGTFRPEDKLTRAEAVKVLNRLFQRGPLHGVSGPTFEDVPPTHWAFKEVEEAAQAHKWARDEAGNETIVTP
ncbi:S-layer homology domain-containing protein [Paenibacillus nanensis]|nr:S-layer homology domain-containing protein [Paenibacillus nanensis]